MGNSANTQPRLVVVGNGMAGVACVEELLALCPSGDGAERPVAITIFGEEPHVNYNRILLSNVLSGQQSIEKIYLNPLRWYEENGIELRKAVRVTSIDRSSHCVTDSSGTTTTYDRLLIAVGAAPFVPPITGVDKQGVFVFRTIDDTEKIVTRARKSKQVVVIGGGLLGLEAARGLVNHGPAVTVVHLMDRLMEQQLDPQSGAMLRREVERLGIEVRLNSTVAEICGDGTATAIKLASGEQLPADMVLICTGVRPDLALARQAGLATHLGILVNDQLQTSAPDIYAVGDVIEHHGRCYGLVAPLREQARVTARMLARELVGLEKDAEPPAYEGTLCSTTLKVAGINLSAAGQYLGGSGFEELVVADTQAAFYRKLVLQSNRLVGMILLGDTRDSPRLFQLIRSGEDLSSVKGQLLGLSTSAATGSPLAAMADTEVICNCHEVTKGTIASVIMEKGLTSRDDVARCTKASSGCGSCAQLVDDLLLETTQQPAAAKPAPRATPPSPSVIDPLPATPPLTGYPVAYPRALEVERIKREGLGVDFDKIREHGVLALTEDDYYRLKTYGICSQKHPGYFMVRIRVPGGRVAARQLLELAQLADVYGRGWGHLTTRQSLELHWVRLEDVPSIWQRLDAIGLSTRSSCGHTMRNVMACEHATSSPTMVIDAQPWAKAITDYFLKRSDLINPEMPNRLNIYVAGCTDCASHAMINDIGFAAVRRPTDGGSAGSSSAIGFSLWVGGSLGAHPALGIQVKPCLAPEEVLPACQAIFEIHMKYGNRNKAKSRLKFLIEQWGAEKFQKVFERSFNAKRTLPENQEFQLPTASEGECRPFPVKRLRAAMLSPFTGTLPPGVMPQHQSGYVRVAVDIPLGELRAAQLEALARIARRYGNNEVCFTKDQEVELHWVEARWARRVARALERAGLSLKQPAHFNVTACPGTEFCVLAVTNAQGAARSLLKRLQPGDRRVADLLRGVSIAISGCPNSCAKHQIADIGLAGTMTTVGKERRYSYLLFLGGRLTAACPLEGQGQAGIAAPVRLGEVVRKGITEEMVVQTIEALLSLVTDEQASAADGSVGVESFQQVIDRVGIRQIGERLAGRLEPFLPHEAERVEMTTDVQAVMV